MKVNGTEYEGAKTYEVFGEQYSMSFADSLVRVLKNHLASGKKICIEFTEGARKGTIAEIVLTPDELDTLFKEIKNSYRSNFIKCTKSQLTLTAGGKQWTLESSYKKRFTGILRFDSEPKFVYVQKKKTEEEKAAERQIPAIYDHFGTEICLGSFVIFPCGTRSEISTRFGYVTNISRAGTVKLRAIKTREKHSDTEVTLSPSVPCSDLIVLDGDIKNKAMMAKLGLDD